MPRPFASTPRALPAALALVLLQAAAAPPAAAGTLTATAAAASDGAVGLRVALAKSCAVDDLVVPGPTVASTRTGCRSVTAAGVEVVAPGAKFLAGSEIRLGELFTVGTDVPFNAALDALLDSPFAFVESAGPAGEKKFNAVFDLRVEALQLAAGDEIEHLAGYAADGTLWFRLLLRWNEALKERRLALAARDETTGGLTEHTTDFLLPNGFNEVQVHWRAGAGDGRLLVSVNGAPLSGLGGLQNPGGAVDLVRWGAIGGTVTKSTGWLDVDDYHSWR